MKFINIPKINNYLNFILIRAIYSYNFPHDVLFEMFLLY